MNFILREAVISAKKQPLYTIYSIITMSIGVLLFLVSIILYDLSGFANQKLNESVVVQVYLENGISESVRKKLENTLESDTLVANLKFIDKETAKSRFIRETGEDFSRILDYNPLPERFDLTLRESDYSEYQLNTTLDRIRNYEGVADVVFDNAIYFDLLYRVQAFQKYLWGATIVLTFIAFYIVFSLSSALIHSRSIEIETMKLVGSTKLLIRAPILLNGIFVGFIGGLVAVSPLLLLRNFLMSVVPIQFSGEISKYVVFGVVFGATIGILSSFFAVRKVTLKI